MTESEMLQHIAKLTEQNNKISEIVSNALSIDQITFHALNLQLQTINNSITIMLFALMFVRK